MNKDEFLNLWKQYFKSGNRPETNPLFLQGWMDRADRSRYYRPSRFSPFLERYKTQIDRCGIANYTLQVFDRAFPPLRQLTHVKETFIDGRPTRIARYLTLTAVDSEDDGQVSATSPVII